MKSVMAFSISPSIIGWSITGIAVLFLIAGLLWGLIRGLKKTTFRAVWLVLTAVIIFFITPVITKAIVNLNISFLNLTINGTSVTSINQIIIKLLSETPEIANIVAGNPSVLNLITMLPLILINAFMFVILFWLVKIVLWPVWAIIAKCVYKNKTESGEKVKKHRGFGMLVGAFVGVFVGALTLMPVLGFVDVANKVENISAQSQTNERNVNNKGGLITELAGKDIANYLTFYDTSVLKYVYKYTGIEFLNTTAFNYLSSTNVNNERIVLNKEIENVLYTYNDIKQIRNYNFSNLTKEQITEIITLSKSVINRTFNTKLIYSVGNDLLPYMINEMLENPDFVVQLPATGTKEFDDVIRESLTAFKDINMNELKNEILSLIDCVSVLNNNDILVPIMNGTEKDPVVIAKMLNEDVVNELANNLFKMKTVGTVVPLSLNATFVYAAKYLEIEFNNTGNVQDINTLKQTFKDMVNTSVSLLNTLDFNSKYYVTKNSLPYVGTLLNSLKGYSGLTDDAYNQLLGGVETKINAEIDKLIVDAANNIPESLLTSLKTSVQQLKLIQDFKVEFEKYVPIFDDAVNFIDGVNNDNIDLKKAGKIIDALKNTELFGKNIDGIIAGGLDIISNTIPSDNADLAGVKQILIDIKTNINKDVNYETDLPNLTALMNAVKKMVSSANLSDELLNGTLLTELGSALDTAKSSVLLGSEVNNLVAEIVNIARKNISVSESLKVQLDEVFGKLEENIKNDTPKVWATEFTNLKDMINMISGNTGGNIAFETVGRTLDQILFNSVIINNDLVNSLVKIFIDEAVKNANITLEHELAEFPIILKNNLDKVESYEKEFKCLEQFMNDINDIKDVDITNITTLEQFGVKLDSYSEVGGANESKLISSVRTTLLKYLVGCAVRSEEGKGASANETTLLILRDMYNNVDNIDSFAKELKYLQDILNQFKNGFDFNINSDLSTIGNMFDQMYLHSTLLKNSGKIATTAIFKTINFSTLDANLAQTVENIKQEVLTQTTNNVNRLSYVDAFAEMINLSSQLTNLNYNINELDTNIVSVFDTLQSYRIVGVENTKAIATNVIEKMKGEVQEIVVSDEIAVNAKAEIINNLNSKINQIQNTTDNIHYVTLLSDAFEAVNAFTKLYPKV